MSRARFRWWKGLGRRVGIFCVFGALVASWRLNAAELRWRFPDGRPEDAFVQALGLDPTDAAAVERLAVYVVSDDLAQDLNAPPMLGGATWKGGVLTFTPRFPLIPGRAYRAVYRPIVGAPVTRRFRVPERRVEEATRVSAVYPSAAVLPENLLKFYLHFSAPMRRGQAYDYVGLFRADGSRVDLPFLEIDQELWDPEQTRLTLLIDPGRIKRGVQPLEDLGPALEMGGAYELRVAPSWPDARGAPLVAGFSKRFRVSAQQRQAIDPEQWRVVVPQAGTRQSVVVAFDRPMDRALALRLIDVVDEAGRVVGGRKATAHEETRWVLEPEATWAPGDYRVRAWTTLEDLTGANIGKPFEVDVVETGRVRIEAEAVYLPFRLERP